MSTGVDVESIEYRSGGLHIDVGARTDVGLRRSENQDDLAISVDNGRLALVVCDGMGGHAAGSVASNVALRAFVGHITQAGPFDGDQIQSAVAAATSSMRLEVAENPNVAGMGTTLASVWVEGRRALIAHVGDSRVYRLREGGLERLTDDHSLVFDMMRRGEITEAEAAVHPRRNVITRALDGSDSVHADVSAIELNDGDRILICSDGLNAMVPDADIERLLASNRSVRAVCDALVEAALQGGGKDNVTVVVARVEADSRSDERDAPSTTGAAVGGGRRFWLGVSGWKPLMLITGSIAFAVIFVWYVWFEPIVTETSRPTHDTTLIDTTGIDSNRPRAMPSWEGDTPDSTVDHQPQ